MEMAGLIFVVTFLIVAVLLSGAWMVATADSSQDVVRRRMESVRKAERRGDVSIGLKLVRDEMLSSVPILHRVLLRWSWSTRLREYLLQAGMAIKPAKLILVSGVLGLATQFILSSLYKGLPGIATIAAGLVAFTLPFLFVAWKRKRRLRQFEERFPEALDLLGRAVRAGHAFTTGLEMIAKDSPEPVAGEFRTAFEEQNFGLPLRDALLNMTERIPLIDVRFFVTALLIQKETGGNLAEILDGLARVIRERFRIFREVRVRTAQGRLTAGILIAMPVFMLCVLSVLNPSYIRVLFEDPKGPIVLTVAAVMQILGSVIIWRIIQIEV
jgi:tight adherence protein B